MEPEDSSPRPFRGKFIGVFLLLIILLALVPGIRFLRAAPLLLNQMVRSTLGNSGTNAASSTYRLRGTFSQSSIASGISTNATSRLASGFWAGIPQRVGVTPTPTVTGTPFTATPTATMSIPTEVPTFTPTFTGTPSKATPTITGTPPTSTPTPTLTAGPPTQVSTITPTATGTPPTATPTFTGTPPTATPTREGSGREKVYLPLILKGGIGGP